MGYKRRGDRGGETYVEGKTYPYNHLLPIQNFLDSEGKDTGKKMRFVDMAIEFDNTYKYNLPRNPDRLINLVYSLAFMLACKKRYFTELRDYDIFAGDVALEIWDRFEHPRDPDKPIKSCLNYMKGIIGFRKITYLRKKFGSGFNVINENDNILRGNILEKYAQDHYEMEVNIRRSYIMDNFFREIPSKIREFLPGNIPAYLQQNLIHSVILSFMYKKDISWNVGPEYDAVIRYAQNSLQIGMKEELGEICAMFTPSEEDLDVLMKSAWQGNGEDSDVHSE